MKRMLRSLAIAPLIFFNFSNNGQAYAQSNSDCHQFRTQTQGGWGAPATGNNPGAYRDAHFASAFPGGIILGCEKTLTFTSAAVVETFLPSGGTPRALEQSLVDPGTYGNVLAGQLLALTLSIGFDAYDPGFSPSLTWLGDQIVSQGPFAGYSVAFIVAEANKVLGGCSSQYSPAQLSEVLSSINQNYVDGTSNGGFLNCPDPEPTCHISVGGLAIECGENGVYTVAIALTGANGAFIVHAPGALSGHGSIFCLGNPVDSDATLSAQAVLTFQMGVNYSFQLLSTAVDGCNQGSGNCQTSLLQGMSPDCCSLEITCPAGQGGSFTCISEIPVADPSLIGVGSNCGEVSITFSEAQLGNGCQNNPLVLTRTYVITDGSNSAICVQTFKVIDSTPPVMVCPPDQYASCSGPVLPDVYPTASDNCGGNVQVSFSNGIAGNCGSFVRTWIAIDPCGNMSTCQQTVFVSDNTPPSITAPPSVTVGCQASTDPIFTGFPLASDFCSDVSITYTDSAPEGNACHEQFVRTWIATDACGNVANAQQTIAKVDNAGPIIYGVPLAQAQQCGEAPLPGEPYAIDQCQGDSVPVILTEQELTLGCNRTIWRTYTATDVCGNSTSIVRMISIQDTQGPDIACPDDVLLNCGDEVPTPEEIGFATAIDNCSGDLVDITFSDSELESAVCPPTITRIWIAVDTCGNASSCEQKIQFIDQTPPVITCPGNVTVNCSETGSSPQEIGFAEASDDCSDVALTWQDSPMQGTCPVTIMRIWTAVDACGNTAQCVQMITLIDNTPPVINCPADIEIDCGYSNVPVWLTGTASATDHCSNVSLSYMDGPLMGQCPKVFERTWTASDYCGNISTCVQTIALADNMLPLVNCPADVVIPCSSDTSPEYIGVATALDFCSDVSVSYADFDVAGACPASIARVWTATDACGNKRSCTQYIMFESDELPQIICPPDATLPCGMEALPTLTGMALADAACGDVSLTYSDSIAYSDPGTGNGGGNSTNDCGTFRTQTQGGWGAPANGNNPGAYRDANFEAAFPQGLVVGCNHSLTLTNAGAVQAFLPSGGPVAILTQNLIDPTGFSSVLAGQLVAASLSVGFDAYDPYFGASELWLGNMLIGSGPFEGNSVAEVLVLANEYFGGCNFDLSGTDLVQVLTSINENYVDGLVNGNFLQCPDSEDGGEEQEPGCGQIIRTWTATDGCGNEIQCVQTINFSPVLPPREPLNYDAGIAVWPSPTRSEATIQSPDGQYMSGTIEVLNMNGQVVMREALVAKTLLYTLNLHALDPGLYLIRIFNSNEIRTAKVIKQ